jgi:hypothetical protein
VGGGIDAGGFYDGNRTSIALRSTWNGSRHLEVRGNYSLNHVEFRDRATGFNAHTLLVRTTVGIDTRWSAVTTVQWNSLVRQAGAQLRIRYNPREGDDLYIVYGHGWNTDRLGLAPLPPSTSTRRLMIKYTRTLSLGT